MKEATGELNMTVITVVAIAAVAAFFYAFVWPAIKNTLTRTTDCNSASCASCEDSGNKRVCTGCVLIGTDGQEKDIGKCVYNNGDVGGNGGGNGGGNAGGTQPQ